MGDVFETDVAVIGAGPIGLASVFYNGMCGFRSIVLDYMSNKGGQCSALYPKKPIYDIPTHKSIYAEDLVQMLTNQAAVFDPLYLTGQDVLSVINDKQSENKPVTVKTASGVTVHAKAAVIASGGGKLRHKKLPIEAAAKLEGTKVLYDLSSINESFKNREVIVLGGGDSAADAALMLYNVGAKVKLVHRRAKFRGSPYTIKTLWALADIYYNIFEIMTPYQIYDLHDAQAGVRVTLQNISTGELQEFLVDVLMPFFGLEQDLSMADASGLKRSDHGISVNGATMCTSSSSIYAVGDCAHYEGKLKLIVNGFAECSTAAHSILNELNHGRLVHFEHSTSKGPPGFDSIK